MSTLQAVYGLGKNGRIDFQYHGTFKDEYEPFDTSREYFCLRSYTLSIMISQRESLAYPVPCGIGCIVWIYVRRSLIRCTN